MTDARLASSGACPRRSQVLIASPPSAAGVVRLKASPASLEVNRTRKPTSRRNAKRQPSVSNTATATAGKHRVTAGRQERAGIRPDDGRRVVLGDEHGEQRRAEQEERDAQVGQVSFPGRTRGPPQRA